LSISSACQNESASNVLFNIIYFQLYAVIMGGKIEGLASVLWMKANQSAATGSAIKDLMPMLLMVQSVSKDHRYWRE
jgi:hypothetical protein